MNDDSGRPEAESGDPRSYHPPPTPRTYIADAWRHPERRREVIDYLASEYDWYIDRMVPAKLRDLGWHADVDAETCAMDVKKRFLMPDDGDLAKAETGFWLERWDRERGPLRNFFRTCIRNFIRDWCRKNRDRRSISGDASAGGGETSGIFAETPSPEPSPAELAEQSEFEARYDKGLFIGMAMDAYRFECGEGSRRWEAYKIYTGSWPQPTMRKVAAMLGIGPDEVNNHIHRGRVRVQELLWWQVRALEMDDISADRAILELVGRLPACRERNTLPNPPSC